MIYKIVKGNSFALHITIQKTSASENVQRLEPLDVTKISNLEVVLDSPFSESQELKIKQIGISQGTTYINEICVEFPSNLDEGNYGITLKGRYNGNDICSIEKNVFKIVSSNSKSCVPLGIVEGETSGMYNTRYWIELNTTETKIVSYYGAASTQVATEINVDNLTKVPDSLIGQTITVETTEDKDILWIVSSIPLSFVQSGLPLEMNVTELNEMYFYSSDELTPGKSVISIV